MNLEQLYNKEAKGVSSQIASIEAQIEELQAKLAKLEDGAREHKRFNDNLQDSMAQRSHKFFTCPLDETQSKFYAQYKAEILGQNEGSKASALLGEIQAEHSNLLKMIDQITQEIEELKQKRLGLLNEYTSLKKAEERERQKNERNNN